MALGLAGTLFANQVQANAGKAGLLGVVGGLAFNMLLRRSPAGAMILGGAFLARQVYKAGQEAKTRRAIGLTPEETPKETTPRPTSA